jgi:hypothetical protein
MLSSDGYGSSIFGRATVCPHIGRSLDNLEWPSARLLRRWLELLSHHRILRGEVGRGTPRKRDSHRVGKSAIIDLAIDGGSPHVITEDSFKSAAERAVRAALSLRHGATQTSAERHPNVACSPTG